MTKRIVLRKCRMCSKEIPSGGRADRVYCSNKCGDKYRRLKHYRNNPEYYSEKRKVENSNVEKRILSRVKSRAKKHGIPFNLDCSDIEVPETCPVLGIEIYSVSGGVYNQMNTPSLDRILPDLGYIKGNVRVISNRANLLKSNATIEELTLVLEDLKCLRE